MNNDIKEILDKLKKLCYDDYCLEFSVDYIERKEEKLLLDYITNLQQENEKLKKKLDCKERLTKIMPEDTEFIILSKADYDRQIDDIELTAIELKSRIEKAVEYTERYSFISDISGWGNSSRYVPLEFKRDYYENGSIFTETENLLNILNGRSDK